MKEKRHKMLNQIIILTNIMSCHRLSPLLRNLQLIYLHLNDGDDFHSRSLPWETSWGSKYFKVHQELKVTSELFF